MKNLLLILSLFCVSSIFTTAQESFGYQQPSKEILELVDFERAPAVIMDSKKQTLVYLYSPTYKSLEEISESELKVAGQRINPMTNMTSKARYFTKVSIQLNRTGEPKLVQGLPENSKLVSLSWSPDENYIACGNIVKNGVELWVIDLKKGSAKKMSEPSLNNNLTNPISWFSDSKSLLVKMMPSGITTYLDAKSEIPSGPNVIESDGTIAQNRTYPDLIKNKVDEANFTTLATSSLQKISLDGTVTEWKKADLHRSVEFSPDGKHVLISTIQQPYSTLVPWYNFGTKTEVYSADGKFVAEIENKPAADNLPKGFMAVEKFKRSISWRSDVAASLIYVVALDGGNPEVEVENRDEVFQLNAPFSKGTEQSLLKTKQRFANITWGNSTTCIVYDYWYNTRNSKTYLFNPSNPSQGLTILFDRDFQDEYSNPGEFETVRNEFNKYVLQLDGMNTYMIGEGHSKEGQFPFVNQFNLQTKSTKTLYRSSYKNKIESIVAILDIKKGDLLVRIEAPTEYPNYFTRKMTGKAAPIAVTNFKNPFEKMNGISKEVIKYKREDGLELSATLYLPAGYDKTKKEKLPMIMWAYPQEFKDKQSAGQNTKNPNEFIFPYYGSPIYWVMKGYAILDDAAFPIVGEGDEEPNDSFITQLVSNAKAAIDAVDNLGYIDRTKVAVGGHSYGAFMTANLLTHSNLFAAGIARSGAYNRSLTPFGFQGEERTYWEAQNVYNEMSPFNYADKMKTPMLLVHGEDDNNSGTFPIQSERYFQALKGFGAPVRYVVLPKESHGYAAKESILHLMWEQDMWLEKYLKGE